MTRPAEDVMEATDITLPIVSLVASRERNGEMDPDVKIIPDVPATAHTLKRARRVAKVGGRWIVEYPK
eukprot:scaffold291823_cov33-Tisochrysis_lutea.AAC.5